MFIFFNQIGTAFTGQLNTFLKSPFGDILVMTREQNGRNLFSVPYFGASIVGIFKKSIINTFIFKAYGIR